MRLILQAREQHRPGRPDDGRHLLGSATRTDHGRSYPFPNLRAGLQRTDVVVYDDETPNVVTIPSGTDTVVVQCFDTPAASPASPTAT